MYKYILYSLEFKAKWENMRKIYYSFLFMLLIYTASAFMLTSESGVTLQYEIPYKTLCHSKVGRFTVEKGLSVLQCVEACGLRQHCAALTYRRRYSLCELFLSTDEDELSLGDCIFVDASDIAVTEMPCGDCSYGQTCDPFLRACVYEECLNTNISTKIETLGNRNGIGDMLKYDCTVGYLEKTGVTSENAVCLETGRWDISTQCAMDCGNPPSINNGHVTSINSESANVVCDTGYESTTTLVVCTDSGFWDTVTCDPIDCGDPPTIIRGNAVLDTVGGTYYSDTATVTCEVGYQSSRMTIMCTLSGFWDTAICDPIACGGNLPALVNGTVVLDNANGIYYLDTATVTCDGWYEANRNNIMCTSDGTWQTPICKDCYPGAPQEYSGKASITENGIQCQRWDSQFPHYHDNTDLQYYPDPTLADAKNYCRTPEDGDYDPWCYTMDPGKIWEYCNVKKCPWA